MLKDIQNLPEKKKNIILWTIVTVIAIIIVTVQIIHIKNRIEEINFRSSPVTDVGNFLRSGIINVSEMLNQSPKDE